MEWPLEHISLVLGSGVLGALLTFFLSLRKDKRDDYVTIIEAYKQEFERQNKKIDELEKDLMESNAKIDNLTLELAKLRVFTQKHKVLDPAHCTLPIPFWIKDTSGVFLHMNNAFVDKFLTPFGMTEEETLGTVNEKYLESDKLALEKGTMIITKEIFEKDNHKEDVVVIKWPIKVGTLVVGVGGFCFEDGFLRYEDLTKK